MNAFRKWTDASGEGYTYRCPGCAEDHSVRTIGPGALFFDGNEDAPTFKPAIDVRQAGRVCHGTVTHGRVQFFGDCTHPLRGQTVYLKPVCEVV